MYTQIKLYVYRNINVNIPKYKCKRTSTCFFSTTQLFKLNEKDEFDWKKTEMWIYTILAVSNTYSKHSYSLKINQNT